jgi:tyrosyl-tRNA synthetase
MQAGNLVVVLLMKRLADAGHRIVLVVGGGTGMIGDPKERGERPLADTKTVARNAKALKAQFQRILGTRVTVVNNADWLLSAKLVDFLRDIGKHFTVNELIKRDIIKRRLDTPDESISYTEFAYSLLQGYDFYELNRTRGVDLQLGASDQWTNILSGVELIRRKTGREAFAITCPLVTDASGKKFGKSEGNAVWLDPKKTSPYAFYQFWLNQPDDLVERYLKYYTFLSIADIEAVLAQHAQAPGKRHAQRTLAAAVTTIVHGADAAARAVAVSEALYGGRPLADLSRQERAMLVAEAPSAAVRAGTPVVDALVLTALAPSKGEARRLIEGKGITLDGRTIESVDATVTQEALGAGLALLKRGKQAAVLVKK